MIGYTLQHGDTRGFLLDAKATCYRSGWGLLAGHDYQLVILPPDKWNDFDVPPCDASGTPGQGPFMKAAEGLRTCPDANYMELLIMVDGNKATLKKWRAILAGGGVYRAPCDGELSACSNDVTFMYWNNGGAIYVQVTCLN